MITLSKENKNTVARANVRASGLHCRLGVPIFRFIYHVTLGLKVQYIKAITTGIGVIRVSKSCHKLQLYQFALSRWVSENCDLSNCPDHADLLKMDSRDAICLKSFDRTHIDGPIVRSVGQNGVVYFTIFST